MSAKVLSGSFVAAVMACGVALTAQTQQPPASTAGQTQADSFKIVGCVRAEKDVLKSSTASTMAGNPGMGDEYVLTNAMLHQGAESAASSMQQPEPATAAAQNQFGKVYRATGDKESDLKSYVGQRVEVTGTFKNASDATRETGATGTSGSAAAPTTANSPEFTITAIAPASGSCSPAK